MKNVFTFLLLLFSLLCNGQSPKLFTTDKELSSSLINQIYQDRNGFIWIATEDGLNRYDGAKFTLRASELGLHGGGSRGHDWPDEVGHLVHVFQQGADDGAEPFGVAVLGERPGGLFVHVLVHGAHRNPERLQRLREAQFPEELHEVGGAVVRGFGENVVRFQLIAEGGNLAAEVLGVHGQHAAEQVAEVVGQIGVHAGDDGFGGVGCVGAEVHFTQQEIAEGVETEMFGRLEGIDHVAQRLGHLGVLDQPVAVHVEVPVQRQIRGHEHGGPEDAVGLQNVLGHEMFAGPVFLVVAGLVVFVFRPAEGGDVVGKGVEPHVAHVVLVEGQFDAPGQAGLGTGDAQIFQHAAFEHGERLVAVAFGPDEVGIVENVLLQPVLILGHLEEVVLLADVFGLGQVLGAESVFQFLFGVEALAAVAVVAAVFAEVDVALVVEALQQHLHGLLVIGIGGADEAVVLYAELGPEVAEHAGNVVHEGLRRHAGGRGGLDDLVPVFIGAGLHAGVFAEHAVEALEGVGHDGGVRMAQMRAGVDIVDGRCDVIAFHGDSC